MVHGCCERLLTLAGEWNNGKRRAAKLRRDSAMKFNDNLKCRMFFRHRQPKMKPADWQKWVYWHGRLRDEAKPDRLKYSGPYDMVGSARLCRRINEALAAIKDILENGSPLLETEDDSSNITGCPLLDSFFYDNTGGRTPVLTCLDLSNADERRKTEWAVSTALVPAAYLRNVTACRNTDWEGSLWPLERKKSEETEDRPPYDGRGNTAVASMEKIPMVAIVMKDGDEQDLRKIQKVLFSGCGAFRREAYPDVVLQIPLSHDLDFSKPCHFVRLRFLLENDLTALRDEENSGEIKLDYIIWLVPSRHSGAGLVASLADLSGWTAAGVLPYALRSSQMEYRREARVQEWEMMDVFERMEFANFRHASPEKLRSKFLDLLKFIHEHAERRVRSFAMGGHPADNERMGTFYMPPDEWCNTPWFNFMMWAGNGAVRMHEISKEHVDSAIIEECFSFKDLDVPMPIPEHFRTPRHKHKSRWYILKKMSGRGDAESKASARRSVDCAALAHHNLRYFLALAFAVGDLVFLHVERSAKDIERMARTIGRSYENLLARLRGERHRNKDGSLRSPKFLSFRSWLTQNLEKYVEKNRNAMSAEVENSNHRLKANQSCAGMP